jgi:hypothetical protein
MADLHRRSESDEAAAIRCLGPAEEREEQLTYDGLMQQCGRRHVELTVDQAGVAVLLGEVEEPLPGEPCHHWRRRVHGHAA